MYRYYSGDAGVSGLRREYIKMSWVEPGRGIRLLTARMVEGGGPRPERIVYPALGDPCTEPGRFVLYVAGRRDELRLRTTSRSPRRLRRFARDFIKFQGGAPHSISLWRTPWR